MRKKNTQMISSRYLVIALGLASCAMGASVIQHALQPFMPWFSLAAAPAAPAAPSKPSHFDAAKAAGIQAMAQVQARTRARLPPPLFEQPLDATTGVFRHKVVAQYPHDRHAFTQGLFIHKGIMYESTGLYGQSSVRKVDLSTGKVTQMSSYDANIFAEGITMHSDGNIYGLSWQEGVAFRINPDTLVIEEKFRYPFREGWGITSDGTNLIITDSTQTIRFVDTKFNEVRTITVHDPQQRKEIPYINELEYIDGKIYGNVYGLDHIVVVDPADGRVVNWVDCRGLLPPNTRDYNEVLNGIAYDQEHKKLYVTGKNWPTLFHIEIEQV